MSALSELFSEYQWPHIVYYVDGKVIYCPPDTFFIIPKEKKPWESVWFIPGTYDKQFPERGKVV